MSSWRVATFNIRHGLGRDGLVDLSRTAREIRALGAEVIGLQEVDVDFGERSGHADQADALGELLGMHVRFGAALDLPPAEPGRPRRRYGIALLSTHEVLSAQWHLLPQHPSRPPPKEPRGVLRTRLRRRDGEELDVLVTHLDAASRAHRTAQVQGIVDVSRDLTGPAVLLGDMNADPAAPELAALAATGWRDAARTVRAPGAADGDLPTPVGAAPPGRRPPAALRYLLHSLAEVAGLGREVSAGAASGRAASSRAVSRRAGSVRATHPARLPLRRIDAVWVREGLVVSSLEVGARTSSDHRPVVAVLEAART